MAPRGHCSRSYLHRKNKMNTTIELSNTENSTNERRTMVAENASSGIPVFLLWTPYAAIGGILLGLMTVSFIRFHRQHGHKYRERRAEVLRQLNMPDIWKQLSVSVVPPTNGTVLDPDRHCSRSLLKNRNEPETSASAMWSDLLLQQDLKMEKPKSRSGNSLWLLSRIKSKISAKNRNKLRLNYISNLNGSMVDVRCGETESLDTFGRYSSSTNESSLSFYCDGLQPFVNKEKFEMPTLRGKDGLLLSSLSIISGSIRLCSSGEDIKSLSVEEG